MSIFIELNEEEEKEFREGVYEDTKLNDCIRYLSICHPVTRDEFIKRIRKI